MSENSSALSVTPTEITSSLPGSAMRWFKFHHETLHDKQLEMIASKTGVRRCEMMAVWISLLVHASKQEERGVVENFDFELCAYAQEIEEDLIDRIVGALKAAGIIRDGRLAAWQKSQSIEMPISHQDNGKGKRPKTCRERKAEERARKAKTKKSVLVTTRHEMSQDVTTSLDTLGDYRGRENLDSREDEELELQSDRPHQDSNFNKTNSGVLISQQDIDRFLRAYPPTTDPETIIMRELKRAIKKTSLECIIKAATAYKQFPQRNLLMTLGAAKWLRTSQWQVDYDLVADKIHLEHAEYWHRTGGRG